MKEIGEKLKEVRESMGITIEEAAEDLKETVVDLVNIEEGNTAGFQDVSSLKYFIRDYAKYLGIKSDEIMDDFNEFLFDYTSKLSLEDIKTAHKKDEVKKEISSPYTIEQKDKTQKLKWYILFLSLALFLAGTFVLFKFLWK